MSLPPCMPPGAPCSQQELPHTPGKLHCGCRSALRTATNEARRAENHECIHRRPRRPSQRTASTKGPSEIVRARRKSEAPLHGRLERPRIYQGAGNTASKRGSSTRHGSSRPASWPGAAGRAAADCPRAAAKGASLTQSRRRQQRHLCTQPIRWRWACWLSRRRSSGPRTCCCCCWAQVDTRAGVGGEAASASSACSWWRATSAAAASEPGCSRSAPVRGCTTARCALSER